MVLARVALVSVSRVGCCVCMGHSNVHACRTIVVRQLSVTVASGGYGFYVFSVFDPQTQVLRSAVHLGKGGGLLV